MKKCGFFTCSCGCDSSMLIRYFDNTLSLSFLSGDYYSHQGFLGNLKKYFLIIADVLFSSKRRILKEFYISRDELIELKNILLKYKLSTKPQENCSELCFYYEEDVGYAVILRSRLSLSQAISGKGYRAYELTVGERERRVLLRRISRALALS